MLERKKEEVNLSLLDLLASPQVKIAILGQWDEVRCVYACVHSVMVLMDVKIQCLAKGLWYWVLMPTSVNLKNTFMTRMITLVQNVKSDPVGGSA